MRTMLTCGCEYDGPFLLTRCNTHYGRDGSCEQIIREGLEKKARELELQVEGKRSALKECEDENSKFMKQIVELKLALEIAMPSTVHVLSGHVYEADGKLVEWVDGCGRCRIERLLGKTEKRNNVQGENYNDLAAETDED